MSKKWINWVNILFRVFPGKFLEGGIFHENCMKTKEFPFSPKCLSKMKEFEGLIGGIYLQRGRGVSKNFPGAGAPPLSPPLGKTLLFEWFLQIHILHLLLPDFSRVCKLQTIKLYLFYNGLTQGASV